MEQIPSSPNKNNNAALIGIAVIVAVCCACALIIGTLGVVGYQYYQEVATSIPYFPTFEPFDPPTPTEEPNLNRPDEPVSTETLEMLKSTLVPENDPYEIACRLQGKCNLPRVLPTAPEYKVGDKKKFWVTNVNTNENFEIETTLRYVTPHTYFWAEDSLDVDMGDLKRLMDTFEEKIYPTDREFFGSEWTPGVDGDPHIYMVYAGNIGSTVAGYFSSMDSFNPEVHEYSNGHEAFVIEGSQDLGYEYTYAILAHEFVHMIQFNSDRNDVSWLGEGFAEVGAFLNGYEVGGADWSYASSPDLQLNDWADANSPDFGTHYGASFLYLLYYLDRFGEEATQALTANPANDITSVDVTLADLNITDPLTGKLITADDVFMDFAAALFLKDKSVGDGRFTFNNYTDGPQSYATETINTCPAAPITRTVHQYGIDYIGISCAGNFTLHFEGSTVASLLPIDPHSGDYFVWSNKGDESDMTLTRAFDLTSVSGPVEISYWTWYDIEKDYDYLYLEISEDGETWEIVQAPSSTDEDPTGASHGWAYNDKSGGWIEETVDLSAYAGKKIQVRFEYITDAAVNGEGLLLDDVRVDAIGYASDFESDLGGWEANGFVRAQNVLPQIFRLALIIQRDGETSVQYVEVNADQTADIPLAFESGDTVTVIVTGVTRFTRAVATYSIEIK
ncbi:MAG: hypothetical protein HFACDABA_00518 [Anaerolineales bacterium]|nr:hypothetical protein [Anaerolineales bacterium]